MAMTRLQMLAKVNEATTRWNIENADQIPNRYPDGFEPHDGQETDIAEHHAIMSATPDEIGSLEDEIDAIMAEYQSDSNPDRGR